MTESEEEAMMNGETPVEPSSGGLTTPSNVNAEAGPSQGVSKNAMKKAQKKARMDALKPEKRAAEKARRKARSAALRDGYQAGTLSIEDREIFEKRKALRTARKKDTGRSKRDWAGGVIIDLGFDDLMTDQEIVSMASQISFVYSANRTSSHPFSTILHTSFGPTKSPRLWERMSGRGWEKWTRSYWHEADLGDVVKAFGGDDVGAGSAASKEEREGLAKLVVGPILPDTLNPARHKLVYLSADAEEELTTLSENEVYVIGGIVDRNRHKMLCQNKAAGLGIRTARLPIGTYLADLQTRKVLTVNQVFDILVQYLDQQDWAEAFDAVVPQRKFTKHEAKERDDLPRTLSSDSN